MASEIDMLHKNNIAHRDIKAGNMFFSEGEMYLTDHDSCGKIGTFTNIFGTWIFPIDKFLEHDRDFQNIPQMAKKQDKYCFLATMMHSLYKIRTNDNNGIHDVWAINNFVEECIPEHHREVIKNFLNDPINSDIDSLSMIFE